MKNRRKTIVIAAVAAGLAAGAAGIATARGGDDGNEIETPITGPALERASTAALASTGGGEVTETEMNDEDGAYEVEVKRTDGSSVDVHLDGSFNVISTKVDIEEPGDTD